MVQEKSKATAQLSREDWLQGALELCVAGIDRVKIAPLATELGVTTGSFYWHFKDRKELLTSLLEYWEREMTDTAIEAAKQFTGPAADRILAVMETVMTQGLAQYDLPIWQWAQSDADARRVFKRALTKRFEFAAWMFTQAGFFDKQAEARGRMMVIYMMGESTLIPDPMAKRKEFVKLKHAILTSPK